MRETKDIAIGKKKIGEKHPCFIIAEAGVNHNGKIGLAKRLIDSAAEAGADAVKFQTFKAEKLVTKDAKQADYQAKNIGKKESQYEMLKRLELSEKDHPILKRYAEKKGLIFLSTPFDEESIDFLDKLGVFAFKAGSSELNNIPYMIKMAQKKKPMIISTGMSNLKEVENTVKVIRKNGNNKLVVLHCTTNYPCPPDEVNLKAINLFKKKLGCIIGYSDHTEGIIAPLAAVALGAKVIEKHFTLDKKMKGPDHKASIEPQELTEMIKQVRIVEKMLGEEKKAPTRSEKKIAEVARKSVVAAIAIKKGQKITSRMLAVKRPGTGIPPTDFYKIIGKRVKADIKKDELISWEKIK